MPLHYACAGGFIDVGRFLVASAAASSRGEGVGTLYHQSLDSTAAGDSLEVRCRSCTACNVTVWGNISPVHIAYAGPAAQEASAWRLLAHRVHGACCWRVAPLQERQAAQSTWHCSRQVWKRVEEGVQQQRGVVFLNVLPLCRTLTRTGDCRLASTHPRCLCPLLVPRCSVQQSLSLPWRSRRLLSLRPPTRA